MGTTRGGRALGVSYYMLWREYLTTGFAVLVKTLSPKMALESHDVIYLGL